MVKKIETPLRLLITASLALGGCTGGKAFAQGSQTETSPATPKNTLTVPAIRTSMSTVTPTVTEIVTPSPTPTVTPIREQINTPTTEPTETLSVEKSEARKIMVNATNFLEAKGTYSEENLKYVIYKGRLGIDTQPGVVSVPDSQSMVFIQGVLMGYIKVKEKQFVVLGVKDASGKRVVTPVEILVGSVTADYVPVRVAKTSSTSWNMAGADYSRPSQFELESILSANVGKALGMQIDSSFPEESLVTDDTISLFGKILDRGKLNKHAAFMHKLIDVDGVGHKFVCSLWRPKSTDRDIPNSMKVFIKGCDGSSIDIISINDEDDILNLAEKEGSIISTWSLFVPKK